MTARGRGRLWLGVAYAIALGAACVASTLSVGELLWQTAWLDLVGTLVIFGFSVSFNNSSMYDPYWSLVPIVIATYWLIERPGDLSVAPLVMVGLIAFWGLRLTGNFLRGWPGLAHEDWRYVNIRNATGKAYWLASFSGIHLFPTLIVFVSMVGPYEALRAEMPLNLGFWLATLVTAGAVILETVADEQLRAFVTSRESSGQILNHGLWRISRHPNYLGELGFWWGLSLYGISAAPHAWWVFVGPVAMTAMFVFASIPMLDKRSLSRRPGYAEHMAQVPALFPWPRRRR